MADLNISDFQQKAQDYTVNNDTYRSRGGKINGEPELQTLLSGKTNEVQDINAQFSSGNRIPNKMPDFFQSEEAITYFSQLTPEERITLVNKCIATQEVKLETLKNAITSNYNSVRNNISSWILDYSQNKDLVKTFRDFINNIATQFKEAQWNVAQNIDIYTGARAYVDECGLGAGYTDYSGYANKIEIKDAEQQVMKKLGYNSLEDFVTEFSKYDISNAESDPTKMYEFAEKQAAMIANFKNELSGIYEPAIQSRENEANTKYNDQCSMYEYGKKQLNQIAENPPTTPNEVELCRNWLFAPIGYTFMQTVLEYKKETDSVETPTVEVNGKEYEVGKKYQEQGPDGKPRIVTYDRLGNKWDMRGFKIND